MLAGVRRTIGINRETTPPLVTVNMSDVSSTEFPRNGRRRGTSNKIVDQSGINTTVEEEIKIDQRRNTRKKNIDVPEICSTPPNVSKVRSRKGTPNRVAADRTVPNSKAEKMNVDSYIEVSTSTGKTPKKVQFAVNDDDIDSNFSEDSLVEFDARQKSMHSYLSELKKHSPEGKDYEEFTSWTFKKSSEDPAEEVMPRSRDHQNTIANTFEENLDPSEEVMPRSRDQQKTIANTFEENLDLDPPEKVMPKARGRRKTISSTLEENLADLNPPEKGMPKARGGRRTISRALEESLEDFNPFEKVTPKSSNRRKTISSVFEENLEDTNTPHTSDQTSFKRKSVSSVNAAPSPKRLRSGKRNSVAAVTKVKEEPVNNSLECDSSAVEGKLIAF
ncbi:uncharacterized protein LOC118197778 [Stegodyphus dumicola]|uniref:uncharacterized protein LOC118197778 n=1 Tax=Stegodyphus dumicola TaxID=202533 RepID=UPI0015ACEC13|nr:uncharacterized protein LOC118197778 [Stegodyphus dumicola]